MPELATSRSTFIVAPSSSDPSAPTLLMTVEEPGDGTELVRVVRGPNAPATTEISFQPTSPTETLSGQPREWCNTPSAGKPLTFHVPVPTEPGDPDTVGVLRVTPRQAAGGPVRIPIRIRHED
ncbi:MAG: hypothetical protein AB1Z98_20375 [Nannocystaceae bacterium]